MPKWLIVSIVFVSIILVIFGRIHYQNKLGDIAAEANSQTLTQVVDTDDSSAESVESDDGENENESDRNIDIDVDGLTDGIPEDIAEVITQKVNDNEQVEIAAFGSRAIEDWVGVGLTPWPELLEDNLNEVYGNDLFQVNTYSFGIDTSVDVMFENGHVSMAESRPDIVIIESFSWNNNVTGTQEETTIENIETVMETVLNENEDTVVAIQPPHPVYNTTNYPLQVERLRQYAQNQGYFYIDHWEAWPGINDEELLMYVDEETQMPTEEGHELWSDYLSTFFIGESEN